MEVTVADSAARALVRLALAPARPGTYAFAYRAGQTLIECGYMSVAPRRDKHLRGRGRYPLLTPDAVVAMLARLDLAKHVVVVIENYYSDRDNQVPRWIPALTNVTHVASVAEVRIDELDEAIGVPFSIAGAPEGDEMMREIIHDRVGIVVGRDEEVIARAVALLLVEEDLRGQREDISALLDEENDGEDGVRRAASSAARLRDAETLESGDSAVSQWREESERLLTREMLREIVPISDMGLWRWLRAGKFPAPIKFNGRNYWRASEVQSWIESRASSRQVTSKRSSAEFDEPPASFRTSSRRPPPGSRPTPASKGVR